MRTLIIVLSCLLYFTACQHATDTSASEPESIDKAKIEQEVGAILDQYYDAAAGNKDNTLQTLVADDAQLFGTDPEEIFDKAKMLGTLEGYAQDSTMAAMMAQLTYTVNKRMVNIAEDGQQVVVTDYTDLSFSKLPVRTTFICEPKGDTWQIVYANSAFMLKNEDMAKVDALFE